MRTVFESLRYLISGPHPIHLENENATIWDVKIKLSTELHLRPHRQYLYYMGYEIRNDFMKIKDIIKENNNDNEFMLILPKCEYKYSKKRGHS